MKWKIMSKQETGGCEFAYIETGELNRTIEIMCKKNSYTINFYRYDLISRNDKQRTFKTLAAAKKYGEKWLRTEIKKIMRDLKKITG